MVRKSPTPSGRRLTCLLGFGLVALWASPAAPDSGDPCTEPGAVLINELLTNPPRTDGGKEWVELYNGCGADVDLGGWKFYAGTSSLALKHTFATGTVLAAGDTLLLGDAGFTGTADAIADKTMSLGNASTSADAVQLQDSAGQIIDVVVYGTPNSDGWTDEYGVVVTDPGPVPPESYSLARTVDGDNDGTDADDFCTEPSPTPDAPNNPNCVADTPCDGVGTDDTGCVSDTADTADTSGDSPDSAPDTGPDPCAAFAGLVINEVMYDLDGTEDGYEWVELYNGTSATLDLAAITLHSAKSSWTDGVALSGSVAPGDTLLVGESLVSGVEVVVSLDLGNASSSADGVQLRCAGQPVDTVLYGAANSEGLEDDLTWGTGVGSSSIASGVPNNSGLTIGRRVNGLDTDLSGDDFAVQEAPSPDAANPEPPPCVTLGAEAVQLNELLVNSSESGTEAAWEWIELVNTSEDQVVSLAGWALQTADPDFPTDPTDGYRFGADVLLLPGEYLLLAGPSVVVDEAAVQGTLVRYTADDYSDLDFGNATSTADGVRLVDCDGLVVDTVVYAASPEKNTDPLYCDNDDASDVAPVPGEEESVGRSPDGVDTDRCAEDWALFVPDAELAPTPGAPNPEPVPCLTAGGQGLRINELLVDTELDGGDKLWEWVELSNGSAETVDLSGWTLHIAGSAFDPDPDYTFPRGTTLAPGDFLLLAGPSVAVTEAEVQGLLLRYDDAAWPGLGNASRTADGLQLRDCAGTVLDTVVYGDAGTNTEGLLCDNTDPTDIALLPDADQSLGRVTDGVDTNTCAVDFRIYGAGDGLVSTPGQPNDIPPECHLEGRDAVRLNELLSNPGTNASYGSEDEEREWIELVNTSQAAVNLGGWALEVASSSFQRVLTFEETVELPAGGFLVVHGTKFEGERQDGAVYVELPAGALVLGNATSSDDGVRLVDCETAVVDTVLYGPATATPSLEDDVGSAGTLAPAPLENGSIGRFPDGEDTNDHADDWLSFPTSSPGAANPELGGGGGGPDDGCGCGGRGGAPDAPEVEQPGRCTTSPLPPGSWAALGALIALRRRRA